MVGIQLWLYHPGGWLVYHTVIPTKKDVSDCRGRAQRRLEEEELRKVSEAHCATVVVFHGKPRDLQRI